MAEIRIQEQKLKDILKKDPTDAKTREEREAIEKHNEEFERYNGHFQGVMKDLSFNGPRAMVRAAVLATKAEWIEDKYKQAEAELKTVKAERDQYRTELDKIAGVRRKLSSTTGTSPASSAKKNGTGLSVKDLDIRKAFDSYDWGENT
jgi:DNA repair exonuclease SbcCD ATPase subunit